MTRRFRQRIEKLFHDQTLARLEWRVVHICEQDAGAFVTRRLIAGWFEAGQPAAWSCGACGAAREG